MTPQLRKNMGAAAILAAKAVKYEGRNNRILS